jgi:uroporphyrinogen decarboxylase
MSFHVEARHLEAAAKLVDRASSARGLPALDFSAFWARNDRAAKDPFSEKCTHLPLGVFMSDECVFDELGIPPNWRRLLHDDAYHAGLCRAYNDAAEKAVGRRLIQERLLGDRDPERPRVKELSDIFEAKSEWIDESWSYWIHSSASNPDELSALLDRVERVLENLREFILPADWTEQRSRAIAAGKTLPLYRHQRGPVTFATSIYGVENLIFLILDNPDLARRFSGLICRAILERARVMDEEAGYSDSQAPRGWSWADDNCALLTPPMYELFAYPILERVFARYAPGPADRRFQHSDSNMEHLLPVLGRLGFTEVNFGPTLPISAIRKHLPRAVIQGQLAPLVFSRNEEVNIVAETLRDFEMSREKRGVVFSTAGSINAGSRLSGLRLIMAAIEEYCAY